MNLIKIENIYINPDDIQSIKREVFCSGMPSGRSCLFFKNGKSIILDTSPDKLAAKLANTNLVKLYNV